jgi:23S rRNA (adenine1618-N6)-methyltransferase
MRKQPPKPRPAGELEAKPGLHPRNPHRSRYDFPRLIQACPDLAPFVAINAYGSASIDFANAQAVRALNRALLLDVYGISGWDIPSQYLCPPIPGRADYLHHAADLLGSCNGGAIPRGASIRVLDIGVGANCIYPLIGQREYGWHFLGSDTDPVALDSARRILAANPGLQDAIQLRRQASPGAIFRGLLGPDEVFELTVCNPPFHASPGEAQEGSRRKWQNLGRGTGRTQAPVLNFGGQGGELWCPGGEAAFVHRMIEESAEFPTRCFWFTTLVAKSSHLPAVYRALRQAGVQETRTLGMAQGQKKSRIVAWTFLTPDQREAWRAARWGNSARD